jgi:glycosyltransferase involved in cell wall biosynthesis
VPKARLLLVGKGSLIPRAQKTDGVKVFGYVRHIDLSEIYRSVDVFVSPSQNRYLGPFLWGEEFFGYTLMEAMASGLPIVATRCGAIPENVGEGNLLVEQGDAEGLHQTLKELIADKELRFKIGQSNRERAENIFDLQKQIEQLEKAIIRFV